MEGWVSGFSSSWGPFLGGPRGLGSQSSFFLCVFVRQGFGSTKVPDGK